jgi:transcription antitermination factor NusG
MTDWHIALTEPNKERTAFAHLQRLRYNACYPVIPKRRILYGKKTMVYRPMFPGYVFVQRGGNQDWYRLETAPGVRVTHSLLSVNGRYATLNADEMAAVRETAKALNEQIHEKDRAHDFDVGDQVKIKVGPFAEFLAVIEQLDDDARTVGLVTYLLGSQRRIPRVSIDSVVAA